MFQVGDQVIYGVHGVCRIADLETKAVGREKKQYYVLEPVEQPGAVYYVPTQNQAAVSKMRHILSLDQFHEMLQSEVARQEVWIEDENQRKQRYRELIASGDQGAMLSMVRSLYTHKQTQQAAGRKFHVSDENFLRDAEKLLSAEFSLVLGISPAEVAGYMKEQLEK